MLDRKQVKKILVKLKLFDVAKKIYHSKLLYKFRGSSLVTTEMCKGFKHKQDCYLYHRENGKIKTNTILFESFHGDSVSCHPYAIFKHISKLDRYSGFTFVWALKEPKKYQEFFYEFPNVKLVDIKSEEYVEYVATSEFLVNNSTFPNYLNRRKEQKYINTWHGTPLKKMFMDESSERVTVHANSAKNFLHSTHIVLPNDYTVKNILGSSGVDKILKAKVLTGISPRLELTKNTSRKEQLDKLGLPDKKTIFYAPTWRGTLGNSNSQVDKVLEAINGFKTSFPDYNVVLSVHNMAKKHFESMPDIALIDGFIESNEFLSCVDVLVTDYSSIMFDASYAGIPVLLYTYDRAEYLSDRGTYLSIEELKFESSDSLEGIINLIKDSGLDSSGKFEHDHLSPYYLSNNTSMTELCDQLLLGEENNVEFKSINNNKPNVLIYLGGLKPNGISSSAVNLTKSFDYESHNLIILTDGDILDKEIERSQVFKRIDKRAVVVHKIGPIQYTNEEKNAVNQFFGTNFFSKDDLTKYQATFQRELARMLSETKIDVAVDFSGYGRYWALLLGCIDARTKIIYQHNDLMSEAEKRFDILYGVFSTYKLYDKVLSVSKETMELNAKNMSSKYPGISEKFDFLNNYIVPSEIIEKSKSGEVVKLDEKEYLSVGRSEANGRLDLSLVEMPCSDKFSLCNVGRLSPEKDQKKLILAVSKLVESNFNVELFIVGSGPLQDELKGVVKELKLEEHVHLVGQMDNPFYLLSKCDAFVLSSNYEGQPMVLLEALTLGLPVIATDIAGNRSVLQGKFGMLVDNSEDGLVDGIARLINGESVPGGFCHSEYLKNTDNKFRELVLQ